MIQIDQFHLFVVMDVGVSVRRALIDEAAAFVNLERVLRDLLPGGIVQGVSGKYCAFGEDPSK